jgi:hypothetical protein
VIDHIAHTDCLSYLFKGEAISLEYESNPLSRIADSAIKLRTKEAMICPNLESLLTVAAAFKSAMAI